MLDSHRRRIAAFLSLGILATLTAACGAKSPTSDDPVEGAELPAPEAERCNGLDEDLDGAVDEDFRDAEGRYVDALHCGGCNVECMEGPPAPSLAEACLVIDGTPRCGATACAPGFALSRDARCVPAYERLCLPCIDDADCGTFAEARCLEQSGETRCSVACEALACPAGYACDESVDPLAPFCVPSGGSCSCDAGQQFSLACAIDTEGGENCAGIASCDDGVLSSCMPSTEVCDEADNDCDGLIDEGFRDERGAYLLDIAHCGRCGVDCRESTVPEGDLVCGGDPFAPQCVLQCPDSLDGRQPGDRVDGDRIIGTGCECRVSALIDLPGPVGASHEDLDVDCDGADGRVVESVYVAIDGDDANAGSPTRPMRTVQAALDLAAASLGGSAPRRHVFIASGNYTESLRLPDGVEIHGGYRRDFRALDPLGFRVEIRAPIGTEHGAALIAEDAGQSPTRVEWLALRGADARGEGEASAGAILVRPGAQLVLRALEVRSGRGRAGDSGEHGEAGADPASESTPGQAPRPALEDGSHRCQRVEQNTVRGGQGGRNRCAGTDVRGGKGGDARCPRFGETQQAGQRGVGPAPGPGGQGGVDAMGPITEGRAHCDDICCGLADFTVPTDYTGSGAGRPGRDGMPGQGGAACTDALGRFEDGSWKGPIATPGSNGSPGSGGGGGGSGGGAEMTWYEDKCEWPDGLGGAGGGGGAGGCGGAGGVAGSSGGPAVAILLRYDRPPSAAPSFEELRLYPGEGGRGGDGGAGGDGGRGGQGGQGGAVPQEERNTPPLAGPYPGARGGKGGDGGPGGGGGGGCGGSSVGIWVSGLTTEAPGMAAWSSSTELIAARGGRGGRGGGGAIPGGAGEEGEAIHVLLR